MQHIPFFVFRLHRGRAPSYPIAPGWGLLAPGHLIVKRDGRGIQDFTHLVMWPAQEEALIDDAMAIAIGAEVDRHSQLHTVFEEIHPYGAVTLAARDEASGFVARVGRQLRRHLARFILTDGATANGVWSCTTCGAPLVTQGAAQGANEGDERWSCSGGHEEWVHQAWNDRWVLESAPVEDDFPSLGQGSERFAAPTL